MMKLDPIVEGERESEQDGVFEQSFDGELTKAITTESIPESLPVEMEDDESTPIEQSTFKPSSIIENSIADEVKRGSLIGSNKTGSFIISSFRASRITSPGKGKSESIVITCVDQEEQKDAGRVAEKQMSLSPHINIELIDDSSFK